MTMPLLISNYRRQVVENKLYTAYNILQNMVRLSIVENGEPSNWDLENFDYEIFEKYFAPYLKIIEKCKITADTSVYCNTIVNNINGNSKSYYDYKYILNNGVAIMFRPGGTLGTSRRRGTFLVDILSGPKERIIGRNVFPFHFIVDNGRYFITASQDYSSQQNFCDFSTDSLIDRCKEAGSAEGYAYGIHCTALIECNNWKIPKNYPVKF